MAISHLTPNSIHLYLNPDSQEVV